MHNPAPALKNDIHKLLWDFDIHTDHLISARRPDLIVIKKNRTRKIVNFAVPADHRIKLKESEKKDNYLDLVRELKNFIENECDDYTNRDWWIRYNNKRTIKGTGGLGGWRKSEDHPNYSIIENGLWKSPGELLRLAVTQTPVKNHQLTLM